MKDHIERNISISRGGFGKSLVSMINALENSATKTQLFIGKSYMKKLYTRS